LFHILSMFQWFLSTIFFLQYSCVVWLKWRLVQSPKPFQVAFAAKLCNRSTVR
jgi:hypothetical protein